MQFDTPRVGRFYRVNYSPVPASFPDPEFISTDLKRMAPRPPNEIGDWVLENTSQLTTERGIYLVHVWSRPWEPRDSESQEVQP
jgi:hypothetical protein